MIRKTKVWTAKEIEYLSKAINKQDINLEKVALDLGRSVGAVRRKLSKLGLRLRKFKTLNLDSLPDKIRVEHVHINQIVQLIGKNLLESIKNTKMNLKNIKREIKYTGNKKEEISILDLSDLHIGTVNEVFDSKLRRKRVTYNYSIFKKELENLRHSIFEIHTLLSNAYNLKKIYINILGDIVTNDRIFEGQVFHIDRCVGEQMWAAIRDLANFINQLKAIYEEIVVTCVVGNHGRSTSHSKLDEPVANNFEYHVYKVLEHMFKDDKRVSIVVPETRQHIVEIFGWRHLISHGDEIRGTTENYIEKQVKELFINIGEFDVMEFGHFHKANETEIGEKVLVKRNGSFIEKDNFGFKVFKQYSLPAQWFYGCNRQRKETWSYKLDLRTNGTDGSIKG